VKAHEEPEVLVLLSGGVDSAASLQFLAEMGRPLNAVFVNYQQLALEAEANAAAIIARHYKVKLINIRCDGPWGPCSGLVPGRNAFLLATALMYAAPSVTGVAIGIHSGTMYPDCSPEFVRAMQATYDVYHKGRIQVVAPFISWTKGEIWAYASSSGVPLDLTYSCEAASRPCGDCDSCVDRKALNVQAPA
jgi:7-cyano-7-deazaguanine synthase